MARFGEAEWGSAMSGKSERCILATFAWFMLCLGWLNKSAKLTWYAIAKLKIVCRLKFLQKEICHVVNPYVMNYSFNVQMITVKEYSGFNQSQGRSNIYFI